MLVVLPERRAGPHDHSRRFGEAHPRILDDDRAELRVGYLDEVLPGDELRVNRYVRAPADAMAWYPGHLEPVFDLVHLPALSPRRHPRVQRLALR